MLARIRDDLLSGNKKLADWKPSTNKWDWLGTGIYFWEHAPQRALQWAINNRKRLKADHGGSVEPDCIGAVIQLGTCFDLTNIEYTEALSLVYEQVKNEYKQQGWDFPENKPLPHNPLDKDLKMRHLDCLILNETINRAKLLGNIEFDTARGAFTEGDPAYQGGMIMEQSHIQVAVRNAHCILGLFRPTL